jgi:hypothetical protein
MSFDLEFVKYNLTLRFICKRNSLTYPGRNGFNREIRDIPITGSWEPLVILLILALDSLETSLRLLCLRTQLFLGIKSLLLVLERKEAVLVK